MSEKKYTKLAGLYQRQRRGQSEPVYVGRDIKGQHVMVLPNHYRYGPTDPDIVVLIKEPEALQSEPPTLPVIAGRHVDTSLEEAVARHIEHLGYPLLRNLDDLSGRPDFWISRPRPSIIQVQGCRLHGHGCAFIEADYLPPEDLRARHVHDRKMRAIWSQRGVPTIVLWECAIVGAFKLDPAELSRQLDRAINFGVETEITGAFSPTN